MCCFLKKVEIFTDGACLGNPGPGGWAALLRCDGREKEISGSDLCATNNRMELTAVIEALSLLKEKCRVHITTDSKYIVDSVNSGRAEQWRLNGWRKSDKKPALNSDLWERLLDAASRHECTFRWIQGHAGHTENERCDELAVRQAKAAAASVDTFKGGKE